MEGVGLTNPGSLDDLVGGGTKEFTTSGIEFTIHSQLAILAEAASMLPHANIGEEDKDALKIKKDHETYCQRVVSLLKNGTTVKKSSISTAILPRRQVGSGRNFMKRRRRFLQNGNRQSNKEPSHLPSSIPTQTIPSSIEQPEEIASTSKRKLEEEIEAEVVPPITVIVDEVASNSIPKTGVGHRWLRSKAMTNEDFINLQRARDTDISHERKRRRSGSLQRNGCQGQSQDTDERLFYTGGDGMSSTADLSTSLQDPEFSMSLMPKAICAPPERSIYNVSQKISLELVQPPKVDELLDTPPVEASIEDGDKPQEMEVDISASEFTLLPAHDEIKNEDDKSSKSCLKSHKNAWSRHFPFSLRLETPSVPECLPTPAKVMKYSAEFDTNYKIRQRVRELKYEGLWTATRLPKVYERPRSKNHWDYVLEEMTWMAEDFASEKRWKMNAAKQVN
ncbi:unnamed protein product [Orchesella dallaii]|uniref:HSA domain-containing protein n=1 Tax=Orchesella dallaii TaxID=48710 RepID=A0ABP1S8H5_9HEXA